MFYMLLTLCLLFADQLSKFFTVKYLHEYESISIIRNLLNITHVHNTGGPWSIFESYPVFFVIMTIILFLAGFLYFKKNMPKHIIQKISLSLIAGGALGNLADRVFRGYVVDMIDVNLFDYPVFNIADCFIVVGAILMCIYIIFLEKESK